MCELEIKSKSKVAMMNVIPEGLTTTLYCILHQNPAEIKAAKRHITENKVAYLCCAFTEQ